MRHSLSHNSSYGEAFEKIEAGADKFKESCRECITQIRNILDEGGGMFLTIEFDWMLNEFIDFLNHAEVRSISFSRSEDFSVFIKQGYTFTNDKIPIISPIFHQKFKDYEYDFKQLFKGVVLGKTVRFYDDSIQKQIEDANKGLLRIGYIHH